MDVTCKSSPVRRSVNCSIQKTAEYKATPTKPEESELEEWVEALRNGDFTYRDQIIKSHMRLAMSIVGEFATPARVDDLSGEALLAVTQAVEWSGPHLDADGNEVPSRLRDNHITPYIASTVRRFLRDFIETDRTVFMPGRTLRAKVASGEINKNGDNQDPIIIGVLSMTYSGDYVFDDNDTHGDKKFSMPAARNDTPSVEFKEVLSMSTRSDQEREVIAYRSKGYKFKEIAAAMDLSTTHIGYLNAKVEERFNLLYA